MNKVSVVFSVYGFEPDIKVKSICNSIKKQSISCDIILAEQSIKENQNTIRFCEENQIKYTHSVPNILANGNFLFNPGRARNACLKALNTEYIYFSDCDIYFEDTCYLEKLLNYSINHPDIALIRPKIKRLSAESIHDFINHHQPCSYQLDMIENCYINYNKDEDTFSSSYPYERYSLIHNILHVSPSKEFQANIYNPLHFQEFQWSVLSHFGGLFCAQETFRNIGGYTEDYITWGMEDTDIQWKFDNYSGIQLIDNVIPKHSLIHLEHECRCKNDDYNQNYMTFEKRKKISFIDVLRHDKETLIRSLCE